MTLPPIETDRLRLRDFREEDWRAVHEYASDPEVVRYLPFGPNTEGETRSFIASAIAYQFEKPRRHFELAVIQKETERLVGACGFRFTSPRDKEASMGYIFRRTVWGEGYATEAARAMLAFGFDQLGAHRVFATCAPENVASIRVLKRIGMRREGKLRENMLVQGEWRNSFLYAILEREWRRIAPRVSRPIDTGP
jgi:RimJ/RimL family protein N-acetyltransferase